MKYPDGTVCLFEQLGIAASEPECSTAGDYGRGVLRKVVHPRGTETVLTHDDPSEKLINIRDRYGRNVQLEWNGPNGKLGRIIHPVSGEETILSYDATGTKLLSIRDPLNQTVSYQYDGTNRITQETLRNGSVFKCDYSDTTDPAILQAAGGGVVHARRMTAVMGNPDQTEDDLLIVASTWFPSSREQNFFPDSSAAYLKNGNGFVWTYLRTRWGRIYSKQSPGYTTTTLFENSNPPPANATGPFQSVTSVTMPNGLVRKYFWLDAARLDKMEVYPGSGPMLLTDYGYDPNPSPAPYPVLPTSKIQPNGAQWRYQYNSLGDPTEIEGPVNDEELNATTYLAYEQYLPEDPPGTAENPLPGRTKKVTETNRRGFRTVSTYNGSGGLV